MMVALNFEYVGARAAEQWSYRLSCQDSHAEALICDDTHLVINAIVDILTGISF